MKYSAKYVRGILTRLHNLKEEREEKQILLDAATKRLNAYYEANYNARKAVGSNEIYGGAPSMLGNEERPIINTVESLTEIIRSLPV